MHQAFSGSDTSHGVMHNVPDFLRAMSMNVQ